MNKKLLRRTLLFTVGIIISVLLAGCGKNGDAKTSADAGPVELKCMLVGNKPNHIDDVLAEFEKQTQNNLNIKLNIEWSAIADHKEKLKLRMAAGEVYDMVFDAPFADMKTLVPQGAYTELDKYFNNDQYPGLKKAFPKEMVDANIMFGHNYGVPFMRSYGANMDGIFYRRDLAVKYGINQINSYNDLEAFYKKIQENEKGMIPLAVEGRRGFYTMFTFDNPVDRLNSNVFGYSISNINFTFALSGDRKKVIAMAVDGDDQKYYENFPAPYNKYDTRKIEKNREWNKYLEKDAINQKDPVSLLAGGKAASVINSLEYYEDYTNRLKASVPSGELGYFPYMDNTRNMVPRSQVTTYAANNFVCIPVTSKKADTVMKFIDWVYSDQKNHDLFEYGIEGKHWTPVGNDKYDLPENVDPATNYNFPGYELTWTPQMLRFNAKTPDEILKYRQYELKEDSYIKSPMGGFNFNPDPVKNEIAKVSPVMTDIVTPIANGIFDDPVAVQKQAAAKARTLGLDKIQDELKKQLEAFFNNNN